MAHREHGEGSVHQRTDGRWCAIIRLAGGKRVIRYASTRKEAAVLLAELTHRRQRPVHRGRPRPLGERGLFLSLQPTDDERYRARARMPRPCGWRWPWTRCRTHRPDGLQFRCGVAGVVLGGFDTHALPTTSSLRAGLPCRASAVFRGIMNTDDHTCQDLTIARTPHHPQRHATNNSGGLWPDAKALRARGRQPSDGSSWLREPGPRHGCNVDGCPSCAPRAGQRPADCRRLRYFWGNSR